MLLDIVLALKCDGMFTDSSSMPFGSGIAVGRAILRRGRRRGAYRNQHSLPILLLAVSVLLECYAYC